MRLAGHLENEADARLLSDYLHSKGMRNQVDASSGGRWELWIHDDARLAEGTAELERFLANPSSSEYRQSARKGRAWLSARQREDEEFRQRVVDFRTTEIAMDQHGVGWLTAILMGISVIVYLFADLGNNQALKRLLFIDLGQYPTYLGAVKHGEVWRLITPIFLHFGILHIFFNMSLLKLLGTAIEAKEGTVRFALHVLVYAVLSNLGQYFLAGPFFGGMSGVVYGLFGYVWIRGKYDPRRPYNLDRNTTILLLVWFFLAFFAGSVANGAHALGLISGIVWASLSVRRIPFTGIRW